MLEDNHDGEKKQDSEQISWNRVGRRFTDMLREDEEKPLFYIGKDDEDFDDEEFILELQENSSLSSKRA